MSYKIVRVRGSLGIKCGECGLTSHNEVDIKQKYCGNCRKFHKDVKNVGT